MNKRRVLLAGAAAAVAALAAVGTYAVRQFRLDEQAAAAGAAGRRDLEAGRYEAALEGLGRYLQRFQDARVSADDYVCYARARRHVAIPGGAHLHQSLAALRRARTLDPASRAAARDLLDLYVALGYAVESHELLDSLLRDSPEDLALLRIRLEVLTHQREFERATVTAREINRVAPHDLPGYFATLAVSVDSGMPASDVDAWVDATVASHPRDPRFDLLRAALLVRRGDAAGAGPALDRLIAQNAATGDPQFVTLLVGQLDAAGRFSDSLVVLGRFSPGAGDPLGSELVRRLWYAGRVQDVVARTEDHATDADPEVVAIRALALASTGRVSDARALRLQLGAREGPAAAAWGTLVECELAGGRRPPRESYDALRAAAEAVPGSALLLHALGDSCAALGEADMAIDAWRSAAERAGSWPRPLCEISKVLLATPGREASAVGPARAALTRAPNDSATVAVYLRAVAVHAGELTVAERQGMMVVVRSVQLQAPEQAAELLALEVGLAARTDRAETERRLREALASGAEMSEATLLELARVASVAGVPLASEFIDRSAARHGVTPQLALERALVRARTDGPAAGLRELAALRGPAAAGSALDWDLVRARYLDWSLLPEAGRAWAALADDYPDVLEVQLRMLAAASAWSDRSAVARAIERTRAQTGEHATSWRIARGRWLLSAEPDDAAAFAEAGAVLAAVCRETPQNVSAHLLLAQALERLGNLRGAEDELHAAAALGGDGARTTLELARLALRQGHAEAARTMLDRVLAGGEVTGDVAQTAASLLAVEGDLGRSRQILEPAVAAGGPDRAGALLLVRLYASLGEFDRAIALCERLLERADAQTAELLADLRESTGDPAGARAAMRRLDAMDLPAGARELAVARHAANWGSSDEAIAAVRRAVAAAPESGAGWGELLECVIARGDSRSLAQVLADPKAARVEPARFLTGLGALASAAADDPRLKPMLAAAANDVAARPVLTEAMRALVTGWAEPGRRAEVARTMRALADSNAGLLPLQLLAADVSAGAGELKAGIEIARRATSQFPNSAAGARQAALLLGRAGRWEEALAAGLDWRSRVPGRDRPADVFVAQALLRLGRAADAAATLEPHVAASLAGPQGNEALLLAYCVALTRTDRAARAGSLLAGLARSSGRWRLLPLVLEPGQWMATADDATAWLAICAQNVPEEDAELRLALARASGAAWDRFRSAAMLTAARGILGGLVSLPGSTAEQWHEAGLLEHRAGDADAAQRLYLGALARDPAHAVTHNDLAMLLADAGRWQEAVEHAGAAARSVPACAGYRDTLAYALRKGRKFAEAAAALEDASRIEPSNPAWRLGIAEILSETGRQADADREMARVEEMLGAGAEPSASLRERLERLRALRR